MRVFKRGARRPLASISFFWMSNYQLLIWRAGQLWMLGSIFASKRPFKKLLGTWELRVASWLWHGHQDFHTQSLTLGSDYWLVVGGGQAITTTILDIAIVFVSPKTLRVSWHRFSSSELKHHSPKAWSLVKKKAILGGLRRVRNAATVSTWLISKAHEAVGKNVAQIKLPKWWGIIKTGEMNHSPSLSFPICPMTNRF